MPEITSVLEEEVKHKLRQQGLVIWLDKDGYYTEYVDTLVQRYQQGDFFAPVVAYRGSYLETLFALEPYGNGLDPEPLLIHMPGHTEETIRKTPLLELYHAGYRYRRALDTLIREAVTGRVSPNEIEAYLKNEEVSLAGAEAWLEKNINQPKGKLAAHLDLLSLDQILDNLVGQDSKFQEELQLDNGQEILQQHLHRHTGINEQFLQFFQGSLPLSFQDLREAFVAWLMCVEYVNDLERMPRIKDLHPLTTLSPPIQQTCKDLINHLRQRHPDTYASLAAIVETNLETEFTEVTPEDFGRIDTFQREETAVLEGALTALEHSHWTKALKWARSRLETDSFWLQRDPKRRLEWLLIQDAATLGDSLDKAADPLQGIHSLREALDYYTETAYFVDRAHRHFEQQRLKLLEPTLPHFASLLTIRDQLRAYYRRWVDQLSEKFAKICEEQGFLPDADLQQRTLYEQVIHPLTQRPGKVAYFLIDAFRYEMATELMADLTETGTTVTLKARYAELPTITAVGMNVLAPVNQAGNLTLAGQGGFQGFKVGEYSVRKPQDRVRAMGDRSVDNLGSGRRRIRPLDLSEVCQRDRTSLKKSCSDADLIVVHSKEIDDAGEANVGIATFETWLQQLKSAWNLLKNIGVNEFVFTADHGFLLQDQTTQEIPYGTKKDPNRRHILATEPRAEDGAIAVSLSALNYDGQEGYLLFRRDTAVFATRKAGATFVHGGNSLQERIIPVLSVSHRHSSDLAMVNYQIEVKPESELLGFSRIRVQVKPAPVSQGVLNFVGSRTVNVALRVPGRPDIQVTIKDAPGVQLSHQQIPLMTEGEWVEVLFDLKGQQDERVQIEVFHPDAVEDVEPAIPPAYFNVSGSLSGEKQPELDQVTDWQNNFEDESIRQVFCHLQQHHSITETELIQMLGSARKVRRFARDFEEHLKKVPFSVKIETTSNGKRYVKQS